MKRLTICLVATALTLAPRAAGAESMAWTTVWDSNVSQFTSGSSTVYLTHKPSMSGTGTPIAPLDAFNLWMTSSASVKYPDQMHYRPYKLTVDILDDASKQHGTLTFTGYLSGSVNKEKANLTNTFTGKTTQEIHLGNHIYQVSMVGYKPTTIRDIGHLNAGLKMYHNPEPSTLLMAGMGVAGAGAWWLKRRKRPEPLVEA